MIASPASRWRLYDCPLNDLLLSQRASLYGSCGGWACRAVMAAPQWTTIFRTPKMDAQSGVWLEGFSKRDAQVTPPGLVGADCDCECWQVPVLATVHEREATLNVVPWAVFLTTFLFNAVLYAGSVLSPSTLVERAVAGDQVAFEGLPCHRNPRCDLQPYICAIPRLRRAGSLPGACPTSLRFKLAVVGQPANAVFCH